MYLLSMSADSGESSESPRPEDWTAYTQALAEAGVLRGGAGLEGVHTATTVRVRGGERLITDGPFAEAKEHVVGFYVVDVPDLDTALTWAAQVPNARVGSIEVRPLMADSSAAAPVEHATA